MQFRWVDGSKLDYQHWEDGDPHNDANKNCVQIIGNQEFANRDSHLPSLHVGRWSNTQCERRIINILCEKTQDINFAKLAKIVFGLKKKYEKEKKELKDTIAEMQSVEGDLRHRVEELEKNETDLLNFINNFKKNEAFLKNEVSDLRIKVEELEKNDASLKNEVNELRTKIKEISINSSSKEIAEIQKSQSQMNKSIEEIKQELKDVDINGFAPINTIYVQYPFELEPKSVLNCSRNGKWKDISKQYDSLFFRVAGSNSTTWKTVQEEDSSYLCQVYHFACGAYGKGCNGGYHINIPRNGYSDETIDLSHSNDNTLYFRNCGEEVRPRNMAIKIWKCVES